jgi:hypothetical protein
MLGWSAGWSPAAPTPASTASSSVPKRHGCLLRASRPFPATGDSPAALEDAVAETWAGWTARKPIRTGAGTDLLIRPLPAGAAVVGLWWD